MAHCLIQNTRLTVGVKQTVQHYVAAGGTFVLASARPPLAMTALAQQMGWQCRLSVLMVRSLLSQPMIKKLKVLATTPWPAELLPGLYRII